MVAPILFAVGAAITFGIGDFLAHRFSNKADALETLLVVCLIGTVVLAPWAIPTALTTDTRTLGFLALVGVVGFASGVTVYAAYKRATLSIAELVLQLELPFTILFAVWLLGESIGIPTITAIIGLMIGLYLVTGAHLYELRARRGILLAALGALILGLLNYLTAVGARATDSILTNWVMSLVITILCASVLAYQRRLAHTRTVIRQAPTLALGVGLIDTLAWVLYAEAMRRGTLSVTGAIVQGYPLVAVWFAVRFNQDRLSTRQWLGCALVVLAGVALGIQS